VSAHLWRPREGAQVEYESLRRHALSSATLTPSEWPTRFQLLGLTGLVMRPGLDTKWQSTIRGALRPPWTPETDPRMAALADAIEFLLGGQVAVAATRVLGDNP